MCKFYAELKENGAVVRCNNFDNEYFSFKYEKNDDSIKGMFTAKKNIEMMSLVVEYEKDFDNDDLFYALRDIRCDFLFSQLVSIHSIPE